VPATYTVRENDPTLPSIRFTDPECVMIVIDPLIAIQLEELFASSVKVSIPGLNFLYVSNFGTLTVTVHPLRSLELRLVVNELKVTPFALESHLLFEPSFKVPFSPPEKTSEPEVFVFVAADAYPGAIAIIGTARSKPTPALSSVRFTMTT